MERKQRINDLFHFLDENLNNEAHLEVVLEKLDNEIKEELVYEADTEKNEYLYSLLVTKTRGFDNYVKADRTSEAFNWFMTNFLEDVRLHGLGVVED